jgi:hypothetical protein
MFDSSIEVFATHPRLVQVTQDHVVAAPGEQFECFPSARGGFDVVARPPQRDVEEFPQIGFILTACAASTRPS